MWDCASIPKRAHMRTITYKNHRTMAFLEVETHIEPQVEAFLIDRSAQGKSESTLGFYRQKLALFGEYCDAEGVRAITLLTPTLIRSFIIWLRQRGHNKGGVHAFYLALRTFLFWWEEEYEPSGWRNPIRKVKPPRVDKKLA